MISKYFWDLKEEALKEALHALKDPHHPQFSQRMVTLLSRCDKPKELFGVLPKDKFVKAWPQIRAYWLKRERHSENRDWWETIYEQFIETRNTLATVKSAPSRILLTVGQILKEERIQKGLSQKQLAHQTGLTQPVISQIEEGKKNITFFTLVRICKVLDIKTIDIEKCYETVTTP